MKNPKNQQGKDAYLEQLTTEELDELLRLEFNADEEDADPELVLAIMEVIAKREPEDIPSQKLDKTVRTDNRRYPHKARRNRRGVPAAPQTQALVCLSGGCGLCSVCLLCPRSPWFNHTGNHDKLEAEYLLPAEPAGDRHGCRVDKSRLSENCGSCQGLHRYAAVAKLVSGWNNS